MAPERPKKEDYHYKRNGVASLFNPDLQTYRASATPSNQGGLCTLFEAGGSTLPQRGIRVVLDNLSAFYQTFEARHLN